MVVDCNLGVTWNEYIVPVLTWQKIEAGMAFMLLTLFPVLCQKCRQNSFLNPK